MYLAINHPWGVAQVAETHFISVSSSLKDRCKYAAFALQGVLQNFFVGETLNKTRVLVPPGCMAEVNTDPLRRSATPPRLLRVPTGEDQSNVSSQTEIAKHVKK